MFKLVPINNAFEIEGFYTAIRFNWGKSFVFNGESHNFWEAVFVESGRIDVTEDDKAYTLSEGNIIFHAPMEFHRIRSADGSEPRGFIFSFLASGALPDTVKSGVFNMDVVQRRIFDELREYIYDFVHNAPSPYSGMNAASLLKLFINKIAENPIAICNSTSRSALEYQRVTSFMAKNVCENLTLTDIALHTNISVSYMKHLFNLYAGIGPKKYFNLLRVKHASELLGSGYSVTDVSIMMNFSSPNYFSVFFKRYSGISPTQGAS